MDKKNAEQMRKQIQYLTDLIEQAKSGQQDDGQCRDVGRYMGSQRGGKVFQLHRAGQTYNSFLHTSRHHPSSSASSTNSGKISGFVSGCKQHNSNCTSLNSHASVTGNPPGAPSYNVTVDRGSNNSLPKTQTSSHSSSIKQISSTLNEKMISMQSQLAALRKQISERSKGGSPVKSTTASALGNMTSAICSNKTVLKNSGQLATQSSGSDLCSGPVIVQNVSLSKKQVKPAISACSGASTGLKQRNLNANSTPVKALTPEPKSNTLSLYNRKISSHAPLTKSAPYKPPPEYIKRTKYAIVKESATSISMASTSSGSLSDSHLQPSVKGISESHRRMHVGNTKTPAKFVSFSKYAIKRIRRSLSDEAKGSVTVNQSPVQQVARTVRSKYKMRKVNVVRHRNTSRKGKPWYTHQKGDWRYDQYRQPFDWHTGKGRMQNRSFRHGPKGTAVMKMGQYMWSYNSWSCSKHVFPHHIHSHTARKVASLKRKVPFNPAHKLDKRHRPSTLRTAYPHYRYHAGLKVERSRVNLNGVTYLKTKPGSLLRAHSTSSRIAAMRVVNRTVARVAAKYKTDNSRKPKRKYCMFYNRFGKCNRKDSCPYIHDPKKVAVCTRFLRGTCKIKDCPFSHEVCKEKIPACLYFQKGGCSKDDCPYLHVKVNDDAEVCDDFLQGYCLRGDKCKQKHILDCPTFQRIGSCPKGKNCHLQHKKPTRRKTEYMKRIRDENIAKGIKIEVEDSGYQDSISGLTSTTDDNVRKTDNNRETKSDIEESKRDIDNSAKGPNGKEPNNSGKGSDNSGKEPDNSILGLDNNAKEDDGAKDKESASDRTSAIDSNGKEKDGAKGRGTSKGTDSGLVQFPKKKLPAYISLRPVKPVQEIIVLLDDDDEGKSSIKIRPQLS